MTGPGTPSLQLVDEAALVLHAPSLSAEQVTGLLVELVGELELGDEALYLPSSGVPRPPKEGLAAAPVHRGHSTTGRPVLDGVLWYRPANGVVARHVETLAAHASLALTAVADREEMARREDSVRRISEKLQDSLLPSLPELDQTRLAVEYRAAGRDNRVGGDFYDVFPMPDGRVLVVGDVMGKGVEAASRTSRITQTLRALAMQGLELHELLARVDEQVSFQDPDVMATLWCGLYILATGELDFASLGHPPALLLREGNADPIHLTVTGLPLGLRDLSEEPPECRDRQLAPRDLLVLYTDGVIESSGDVIAGLEALHATVRARRDEPLDRLVHHALDELLAKGGHTDDAVLLLLRRT